MAAKNHRPNANKSSKPGAAGAKSKNREEILRLREEANARRKREEAAAKRKRTLTQIAVVVGAIALVAGIVALAILAPKLLGKQNTPEAVNGTVNVTAADGTEVPVPIAVTDDAITVGQADAPVTINYWFDFSCPHCRDYHNALGSVYESVVADGSAKIEYHMIKFVNDYGIRAGSSVTSAIEHQPELFLNLMDTYFAIEPQQLVSWNYDQWAQSLAENGVTNEQALQDARDGKYAWWITNNTQGARAAGVTGTPSVGINGQIQPQLPTDEAGLRALLVANGAPEQPAAPAPESPATTTEPSTEPETTPAAEPSTPQPTNG